MQTIKIPEPSDFIHTVEMMIEKYWINDCIYRKCITEFAKLELKDLEEKHRTSIIKPFIITWGQMQRHLGEAGVTGIFQKLKDQSYASKLEPLRSVSLESLRLENLKEQVISLFDELMDSKFEPRREMKGGSIKVGKPKRICYTATSKILHLCCPSLFMMWDTNIRNQYHKYHEEHDNDGKDYFGFLLNTIEILNDLNSQIEEVSKKHHLRPTRIIDMYNWAKYSENKS